MKKFVELRGLSVIRDIYQCRLAYALDTVQADEEGLVDVFVFVFLDAFEDEGDDYLGLVVYSWRHVAEKCGVYVGVGAGPDVVRVRDKQCIPCSYVFRRPGYSPKINIEASHSTQDH